MRPHELELKRTENGEPGLAARISRINSAGSVVKVRLITPSGEDWQVDLSYDKFEELAPQVGETVFIYPRKPRVFVPDYVI